MHLSEKNLLVYVCQVGDINKNARFTMNGTWTEHGFAMLDDNIHLGRIGRNLAGRGSMSRSGCVSTGGRSHKKNG